MLERHGPTGARWSLLWALGPSFGRRRHWLMEPDQRRSPDNAGPANGFDLRRTEARLEAAGGVMFRSESRRFGMLLSLSPYVVGYSGQASLTHSRAELVDYQQRWGMSATLTWFGAGGSTGSPGSGSRR